MFGERVRAHRRRLGWTQEELASATGLSVRSVGKLRDAQLQRLDATLAGAAGQAAESRGGPAEPAVPRIAVVSGTAGVGKSALAVHWAHGAADRFPDGQLYVNLRGFDPGGQVMGPSAAIRGFLDAPGVPPPRIPVGLVTSRSQLNGLIAVEGAGPVPLDLFRDRGS